MIAEEQILGNNSKNQFSRFGKYDKIEILLLVEISTWVPFPRIWFQNFTKLFEYWNFSRYS